MIDHAWELRKAGATRKDFDNLFDKAYEEGKGLIGGKPEIRQVDGELVVLIDGPNEEFLEVARSEGWTARKVGGRNATEGNGG